MRSYSRFSVSSVLDSRWSRWNDHFTKFLCPFTTEAIRNLGARDGRSPPPFIQLSACICLLLHMATMISNGMLWSTSSPILHRMVDRVNFLMRKPQRYTIGIRQKAQKGFTLGRTPSKPMDYMEQQPVFTIVSNHQAAVDNPNVDMLTQEVFKLQMSSRWGLLARAHMSRDTSRGYFGNTVTSAWYTWTI